MHPKNLFIIIAVLLLIPGSVFGKGKYPVVWEPEKIKQIAIPGSTVEIPVYVTSRKKVSNAAIKITKKLQPYVSFIPEQPINLPKNETIRLTIRLAVPPSTKVGHYHGTIHLREGKRTLAKPLKFQIEVIANDFMGSVDLPFDKDTTVELLLPGASLTVGTQGSFNIEYPPQFPFLIQGLVDGNLVALSFLNPSTRENKISCLDTAATLVILTNLLFVPPNVTQELYELVKNEDEIISLAELICSELALTTEALVQPSIEMEERLRSASEQVQQTLNQLLTEQEDKP